MNTYLSWDNYFMAIAFIASLRSKDPNTKVGAVLVDGDKHIIGTGYNGFIKGIDESKLPFCRDGEWLQTKYPYVIHAEINCILNSITSTLKDSTLYCTLFPCNECVKAIIQKGIKEIVYLNEPKIHDIYVASKRLIDLSNIECRKLKGFSISSIVNTV